MDNAQEGYKFRYFKFKTRRCNMLDTSIVGKKFNRLSIVGVERNKRGKNAYLCKCDCGNTIHIDNNIYLLRIPYWEKQNIEIIIYNHLQRLSARDFAEAI